MQYKSSLFLIIFSFYIFPTISSIRNTETKNKNVPNSASIVKNFIDYPFLIQEYTNF